MMTRRVATHRQPPTHAHLLLRPKMLREPWSDAHPHQRIDPRRLAHPIGSIPMAQPILCASGVGTLQINANSRNKETQRGLVSRVKAGRGPCTCHGPGREEWRRKRFASLGAPSISPPLEMPFACFLTRPSNPTTTPKASRITVDSNIVLHAICPRPSPPLSHMSESEACCHSKHATRGRSSAMNRNRQEACQKATLLRPLWATPYLASSRTSAYRA